MLPQCIGNLAAAVPPNDNGVPWWVGATSDLAQEGCPRAACVVARATFDALSSGIAIRLPSAESSRISRSLEKSGATVVLCRILLNLVPQCPVEACGALCVILSARGRGCVPMLFVDPLPPEGEVLPVLLPLLKDGVVAASAASLLCELLILPYTGSLRPHALGNSLVEILRVPSGGEDNECNAAISFLAETYLAYDLVRVANDNPALVEQVILSVSEFTFVEGRGDAEDVANRLISSLETVWARGVVTGTERMAIKGLLTERYVAGIGDLLAAAIRANFFGGAGDGIYAKTLEGGEVSFRKFVLIYHLKIKSAIICKVQGHHDFKFSTILSVCAGGGRDRRRRRRYT